MLAWIQLAAGRTNESFAQSGVEHRIALVEPLELTDYQEAPSAADNLTLLAGEDNGLDLVRTERDGRRADVAILLVSGQGSPGMACQLTKTALNKSSFAPAAFGVVAIQWLSDGDMFTHELGHILGAGHDADVAAGASEYSRAYAADETTGCPAWRSIMARTGPSRYAPILYWSNVGVHFCSDDGKMGVAGKADNARTLNDSGCTVAAFR